MTFVDGVVVQDLFGFGPAEHTEYFRCSDSMYRAECWDPYSNATWWAHPAPTASLDPPGKPPSPSMAAYDAPTMSDASLPKGFFQKMHEAAFLVGGEESARALHALYSQGRGAPWEQLTRLLVIELLEWQLPPDAPLPASHEEEKEALAAEIAACYPEVPPMGLQVDFGIQPFLGLSLDVDLDLDTPFTLPESFFNWPRLRHFCSLRLDPSVGRPETVGDFDAQAERLARCEGLKSLVQLHLNGLGLTATGAAHLVRAPFSAGLRELGLCYEKLGKRGVELVATEPSLASLQALSLEGAFPDDPKRAITALSRAQHWVQLERLELGDNRLTASTFAPLLASPLAPRLKDLSLNTLEPDFANQLGDEGAIAIARSSALNNLTALSLAGNGITDAGALALAESQHLRSLDSLYLADNPIGKKGRAALQARFGESYEP
ncbi:hypothetical protein [Hyalangium rubrum]|uniref:Uncharacterized protein n=1 Tax=Hyalangium rubrum TaxID=3103134 RepID=A0ABU5H8W2_9BACT|nr:hypothetical protein [Hyalangium sp. s54d21]MDY7229524.1 hypothetical protein [Hyalangium sp. s54d21]